MEKHADQDLDYAEKLASPSRHPTSSHGGPSVQPDASSNGGGPYKASNGLECQNSLQLLLMGPTLTTVPTHAPRKEEGNGVRWQCLTIQLLQRRWGALRPERGQDASSKAASHGKKVPSNWLAASQVIMLHDGQREASSS
ncbi:hypothetical protein WJX82_009272 [Trebouxia sp. C0006]